MIGVSEQKFISTKDSFLAVIKDILEPVYSLVLHIIVTYMYITCMFTIKRKSL